MGGRAKAEGPKKGSAESWDPAAAARRPNIPSPIHRSKQDGPKVPNRDPKAQPQTCPLPPWPFRFSASTGARLRLEETRPLNDKKPARKASQATTRGEQMSAKDLYLSKSRYAPGLSPSLPCRPDEDMGGLAGVNTKELKSSKAIPKSEAFPSQTQQSNMARRFQYAYGTPIPPVPSSVPRSSVGLPTPGYAPSFGAQYNLAKPGPAPANSPSGRPDWASK